MLFPLYLAPCVPESFFTDFLQCTFRRRLRAPCLPSPLPVPDILACCVRACCAIEGCCGCWLNCEEDGFRLCREHTEQSVGIMAMAVLPSTAASGFFGLNCDSWQPRVAAGAPSCTRNLCVGGRGMMMMTVVRVSSDRPKGSGKSAPARIVCQASEKDTVANARKFQLDATELLAELLKTNDVKATAQKHVESLSEQFFIIASTYLDLAKKEGNLDVVTKLETTLQTALQVKEATLRPEIRLLNQLLRDTAEKDRANTIQANVQYLAPDSYFFQLLSRMISDVEAGKSNPNRLRLLMQLRMINKETREVAKAMRKKENK